MTKVAMIGCGKLGLPCAEAMAKKHNVTGYDPAPFQSDLVRRTDTIREAVEDRDIIFIAVPTPHDKQYDGIYPTSGLEPKDFSYTTVIEVLQQINQYVTKDQLVVLISTALPSSCRKKFVPHIPNGRFVYNPYLIAMGSVAWDMVNPEMIIIGTEDGSTTAEAKELREFYETIMENDPRYEIGTWEEAEAIKIFYNTWISAKICMSNMIQDVAMKMGNMNVDVVTDALARSTQRITGKKYMTAGMGDSGACHPRDLIALKSLSKETNLGYDLFGALADTREKQAENMAEYLCSFGFPVVIVGKTYKPAVPYVDGSASMLVGHYVELRDVELHYYDPVLKEYPPESLGRAVYLMSHNYDVTYYKQKSGMAKEEITYDVRPEDGSVIVDPWRRREMADSFPNCIFIPYGNTRKG